MGSKENGKKKAAGDEFNDSLNRIVDKLKADGAILDWTIRPRYGYEGYSQNQFSAHELVTFCDKAEAILYGTSSLRGDRVKTHQWDAYNIKQIDPSVEYAYLILPDDERAASKSSKTITDIREHQVFSAIDDVLTLEEFYEMTLAKYSGILGYGRDHNYQGRAFEHVVSETLNNGSNLKRFNGDGASVGYFYPMFEKIVSGLGIQKDEVYAIRATTDIPALPSGGSPKTDVALEASFSSGQSKTFTLSLKNTARKAVSVHEYSADVFWTVLDPENMELRRLLNCFQAAGSMGKMSAVDKESLTKQIKPYLEKLDRWVLGGYGTPGALPIQCADYLLIRDKQSGELSIYSLENYINLIEANNTRDTGFGTAFAWTRPSMKKGKSYKPHIVLKSAIHL